MEIKIAKNGKAVGTLRDGVMTSDDPYLVMWSKNGVPSRGSITRGLEVAEIIDQIKPGQSGFIPAFVDHVQRNGYEVDMDTIDKLAKGELR